MKTKRAKVGLALGGGAAKGLAHVGVLKVLEENKVQIELIVGTSMGAIVGALYCQTRNAFQTEKAILNALSANRLTGLVADVENLITVSQDRKEHHLADTFRRLHLYYHALTNHGVMEGKKMIIAISELLPESSVEALSPRFAAVATDLYSGKPVVLNQGSLRQAVRASASVPLLFPPVEYDGRLLVDGMVTSLVPVEEAFQLGAEVVLAVDVQGPVEKEETPRNAVEVVVRCEGISAYQLKERTLQKAHLVISPFSHTERSWDFHQAEEFIKIGEESTRQKLPVITEMLASSGAKNWLEKVKEFFMQ